MGLEGTSNSPYQMLRWRRSQLLAKRIGFVDFMIVLVNLMIVLVNLIIVLVNLMTEVANAMIKFVD